MKNICIIGGSTGIGKALADSLADEHRVYATFHKHEISSTSTCTYHHLNVLDEYPDTSFLPERIDALIYCPGSINLKPFNRIPASDFLQDYMLNVLGAVKCIQAVLPNLKKSNQGSVVMFSTVAVQTGMPFHAIVSSSKAAVEGLTRALAAELAPVIRVNCIAPSLTDTPLANSLLSTEEKILASANRHPMKKIGTAQDLAAMAKFLVLEDSTWITGQIFHVDGGLSAIR